MSLPLGLSADGFLKTSLSRSTDSSENALIVESTDRIADDHQVLFGSPPDESILAEYDGYVFDRESRVIAEYEVGDGWVRFVDEGDSVATVIKGDSDTFGVVSGAGTVGELFYLVAPRGEQLPRRLAEVDHEPLDKLVSVADSAEGPTLEQEFDTGFDDWADGCSADAFDLWTSNFQAWHGWLSGDEAFSATDFWDFGTGSGGRFNGYFGNQNQVWFGVCQLNFTFANVSMEQRVYVPCDDSICATWEAIPGTSATIGFRERYLYHNHSIYAPSRRGSIDLGYSNNTPRQYFISGAARDSFAPDGQWSGGG
jgi:hypothetical protein